jgi:hypothetical protein
MSEKKRNFLKFIKSGTYTDKSGNRTNTDRAASRVKKIDLDLETMKPASTKKMLTGGQAKIAAKAPPPNVINEKDFEVLRAEKAKGRGMGLQDEKVKPGKVKPVKAVLGIAAMGLMGAKYLKDRKKKAKMDSGLSSSKMPINLVEEYKKKAMGVKSGGVMKYKRGSGLDLPVISSIPPSIHKTKKAQKTAVMKEQFNKQKSRMGKNPNKTLDSPRAGEKFLKRRKELGAAGKALAATRVGKMLLPVAAAGVAAQQYLKSKMKKKDVKKKMGGGMMQKPMGYSTGGPSAGYKSKEDRKKTEKNIKQARSKEGLRSFLSSGNKINQPMRKERYMEGRKARHSAFKKKLGRTAAGIASSLNPVTTAARVIGKVMGKGSKKRDFQKGDYGDISVKKMGGGMMQKPMGYRSGTMVKARGCKLGRTRPTKIT